MTTVTEGTTSSFTLVTNDSIQVSVGPHEVAEVRVVSSTGAKKYGAVLRHTQIIGPYVIGDVLTQTSVRGDTAYTIVSQENSGAPVFAVYDTSGQITGLVAQDGTIQTLASLGVGVTFSNTLLTSSAVVGDGPVVAFTGGPGSCTFTISGTFNDVVATLYFDSGLGYQAADGVSFSAAGSVVIAGLPTACNMKVVTAYVNGGSVAPSGLNATISR
jgi:hypothetical protein